MKKQDHTIITGEIDCQPEEAGYLPTAVSDIDTHLLKLISGNKITAAAYLISKKNKIIACRSMGQLRYDEEKPYLPDTIRNIASVGKLFTSVAILKLIEKGLLHLHQPVCEIIPEFNNKMFEKISIFHLLTHSSGIRPDPGCMFEPYPRNWEWFRKKKWIKEALRDNIFYETGTQWRYASTGFAILGEIIERKSGIDFIQYINENILEPLEMKDSYYIVPEEKEHRICFTSKKEQEWYEEDKNRPDWVAPPGGGGLCSTLSDLQKFGQMLINKGTLKGRRILSRKSVEAMTREQMRLPNYSWGADGADMEYGLGLNVYSNNTLLSPGSFSHEGAGLCGLYMDPVENMVFVYFCPLPPDVGWSTEAVINLRNIAWSGIE